MRRRTSALLCWLLAFAQGLWTLGCQDSISTSGSGGRASTVGAILAAQDLGQLAFSLYRHSIASQPAGAARDAQLAALDGRRDPFVRAVNDIANVRTLQGVSQTAEALFALVDDDTLPTLANHAADVLGRLANDPAALDALARLLQAPQHEALPTRDALRLLGRMFNYPATEQLWHATARLIEENDGVDANGQPNGEPTLVQDLLAFLQGQLQRAGQSGAGGPRLAAALDELSRAMTEEASVRGTFDFGAPEWIVRVDARGLPRVATDPATGRLYAPFEDADGDGLADVDAQGRFVDAQGAPLDLPTFGEPGAPGFDVAGRATAPSGAPLYVYADAKRTNLALHLQLVGDLLARDAERTGLAVLEPALGAPLASGGYDPDGPLGDLAWGALACFEPDVAPPMVRAGQALLERDPALAERLLVSMARALQTGARAAGNGRLGSLRLSDPAMVQLMDDMLPLTDDLLEQPSSGAVSTARHLFDVLADLRQTAPDFPYQFAPLFRYGSVAREGAPDADRNTIDEAASIAVDRSQPAWIGQSDNRSAVHQLLDLLARTDGCSFFGQNLAVLTLDTMADRSPATVDTLVDILMALPGFFPDLICSGLSRDLAALDALATSGALDAFLPIAKAFKDRGETELLVRLLVRLQRDYEQVLRPFEEDLARLLESGAAEACLEALELGRGVADPVSGANALDLTAAALERLVDDDAALAGPRGTVARSRAHLLLEPLREFERRILAAGRGAELDALLEAASAVFLDRVTVGGQEQLRNGSLIPLAARALSALAKALPADAQDRSTEVAAAQQAVRDALGARDLVTLLALVRTIDGAPSRDLIHQGVVDLLTPQRSAPDDIFGALVKVLVIVLQSPPDPAALRDLTPFLVSVLDPASPLVPQTIRAFERLLTADQGRTVLNVIRAALNPAPGETSSPAEVILETVQAVRAAGAGGGPLDAAQLASWLRAAVDFIGDDQTGLGWVFVQIRARKVT